MIKRSTSKLQREIERSARQVDRRVLSAHRWVRQRASHNRRTPQVTDHASTSDVACSDESGDTAVRSELVAHLDCQFRRGACDAHAEEEC